ncbi:MAG: translocation/assembly module TamB domain-containing protein, partial [Bacteroidota bacterium]
NRMFDGFVAMNDSNLQFDFLGKINLNPDIPVFDFRLDLKKALPGKLHFSDRYPNSEMAFLLHANFSGNRVDNLTGSIDVANGYYKNRNGEFDLEGIKLQSISSGLNNYLSFSSEFFNIDINGEYHFQDLLGAFEKSMHRYLPVVDYNPKNREKVNKFGYQLDVKNLDALTAVFFPDIKIETPFLLYGQMDSEHSVFELKGSIPGFQTKNLMIENIFIGNSPKEDVFASRIRFGEILLKNGMKLENLTVDSELANNTVINEIAWGQEDNKKYSGEFLMKATLSDTNNSPYSHIEIEGFPSKIYLADSLWQIQPFTATIDSSTIRIGNFSVNHGNQVLSIDGEIAQNDTSLMSVKLQNLDLANLGKYLDKDLPMQGILNGSAAIQDYYGYRLIFSDLKIREFKFRDQEFGNLALLNQWDHDRALLQSALEISTRQGQKLLVEGNYIPRKRELLYYAYLDELSLVAMETIIRSNISNFQGTGTGKIKIHGTPDKILLDGTLAGKNAGLTVDYTQVNYSFTDSIHFKGDTILFDQIPMSDPLGNGGVFNGTIVHRNFQDMQYNLSVTSPRLLALNTTAGDNPQFFGQVVANGRFNINGRGKSVNLSGSATTLSGTNVNISLEDESVLERYDFIQFISTETTKREKFLLSRENDGDFNLNLTIRATPEARAQLIYNSQIGDVIKAQGEGLLRFGVDNEGNITLSGDYTVERGDYLFTLQNVINKRFTIERGGTIQWSGDPYNAIINISAVYRLKASLYDLLVDSYSNIYQNQRIQVESKILLTEQLSNPNIDFEINFPTVEDRLVEEVRQYFSTQEELNKQILSLVVLGKFYTPEYMRGTYEAQNPNLIGTTASELFSNQLSNWLSQISNNVDIGLNYRPGNQLTNDEIELAMSTQIFNDRVTLNGNIGNNNNPHTANNSQLVGDFDVNVKLIPSGKVQFKAYNRSNNNLIYETAPYTQGVGFTFTEDFNSLNQLFAKMKAVFTRKKKAVDAEKDESSAALSEDKKK